MSNHSKPVGNVMNCEDIQSVLFAYMTQELGTAQSDLVREHLRKCPLCQDEAAGIQQALEILRADSRADYGMPRRLSEERRARMLHAFMHPVLDWMYVHHILVSIAVTGVALLLLFGMLRKMRAWQSEKLDMGIEVLVGPPEEGGGNR